MEKVCWDGRVRQVTGVCTNDRGDSNIFLLLYMGSRIGK